MSSDEWFKYNFNTNPLEQLLGRTSCSRGLVLTLYLNHSSEDIYQLSFDFFCWNNFLGERFLSYRFLTKINFRHSIFRHSIFWHSIFWPFDLQAFRSFGVRSFGVRSFGFSIFWLFDLLAFDLSAFDLLVVDLLAFDQSSATRLLQYNSLNVLNLVITKVSFNQTIQL